jgi:mannose-6-phosphate isomerase-like protein (cupin superfamily)
VGALGKIAAALQVNPSFLVDLPVGEDVSLTRRTERYRLVGAKNGAEWEVLTGDRPYAELSLFMLELNEDMKAPLEQDPRPGDKFLFVVEGVLQIELGEEKIVLRKGDSLHFKASRPVRILNMGDARGRVFWAAWPRHTL